MEVYILQNVAKLHYNLQITFYNLQLQIMLQNLAKIPVIFGRKFSGLTMFVFVLTMSSDII